MSLSDPYQAAYVQLAALLKAEPTFFDVGGVHAAAKDKSVFVVWAGNFTEFSGTDVQKSPYPFRPGNANVTDFISATLVEESQADEGITPTFGSARGGVPCAWNERAKVIYRLTIIGPDARSGPVSAVRWGALKALFKAGMSLGLKGIVRSWAFNSASRLTNIGTVEAPTGGGLRRVMDCRITVNFEFSGQAVLV